MTAACLRKRRAKPHATWHLDEVYLKIDGPTVYLWSADAEGEVLDVLVQSSVLGFLHVASANRGVCKTGIGACPFRADLLIELRQP